MVMPLQTSSRFLRVSIVLLGVALSVTMHAQQQGAQPPQREYRLQALYRAGIAQNYEVVEQTTVERTHSDGSKRTYERKVLMQMTVRAIESLDGIAKIVVNIDSLNYVFRSDGLEISYDSQKDIVLKNFADLNNYIGPLNRPFELTVSPYGEVTKIEGEQIAFWRDYLDENAADLDTVVYAIWRHSLDRENLLQYGDVQKRIIPGVKRGVDSTWKHQFQSRIDGIIFEGKVTSRLAAYEGGRFTLITKDSVPARKNALTHVYGIPSLSTVQGGYATVDNTLQLTTNGTIDELTTISKALVTARVSNETFTHAITSSTHWKLTGQYQW